MNTLGPSASDRASRISWDGRPSPAREVRVSGLMPREHGAYAQLGFPLVTGLVYSGGQPGAVAFAVAAVAFFLLHEPLAVRSGARGAR
ncbi:MAG: YwiC-like family protein, partial [Gemmatimonadota bacterium]